MRPISVLALALFFCLLLVDSKRLPKQQNKFNREVAKVEDYVRAAAREVVRGLKFESDESSNELEKLNRQMKKAKKNLKYAMKYAKRSARVLERWEEKVEDISTSGSNSFEEKKEKLLMQIANNKEIITNLRQALDNLQSTSDDAADSDISDGEVKDYLHDLCQRFLDGPEFLRKKLLSKSDRKNLKRGCKRQSYEA